jgi:hypothetical protein
MKPVLLIGALAVAFSACGFAPAAERALDFARDVRPILAKNCFVCHGPDDNTREAGLRLDRFHSATKEADSGAAPIVPGKPEESELVRRIFSDDEGERMPPSEAKSQLTGEQKETLRRWIAAGARYTEHWAFVPPKQPPLPAVKQSDWPRNEIDHFILARLEAEGLSPSPPADKHTLVRRIYLDLIGLPPTPQEVDAFLADEAPRAYERLVDRLLASEHYGERWARLWLDLARYADTNGYEKDRGRSIWPYRDWVIRALNADMPFDRFTIEQLAGDMLPGATRDQRIATGFHRNTMLNEEGGIDPLEFRFHAMTDRVATTGTTWLGLTTGCAQCHSHKFDPITHNEYYGLMALLNNADEPELDLPSAEMDEQHRRNLAEAERLLTDLSKEAQSKSDFEARFAEWLQRERERTVDWKPLRPTKATSNMPLLTVEDDDSIFASGDTTKQDLYELEFQPGMEGITALRLEALPDARLPAHGPGMTYYEGTKGDFFLAELKVAGTLRAPSAAVEEDSANSADGARSVPATIARASHSYAKNRFGNNPAAAVMATDGDVQTGWSVDGRTGERHTAVFVFEQPVSAETLRIEMTFGRHFASSLGRFRISATTHPGGGEARDLPEEVETLLAIPEEKLTDDQRNRLRNQFLLQSPDFAEQTNKIRQLQKRPEYPTTLVMHERPPTNPRRTFRHHRGEFLQPKEPVEPGVPEVLPPLKAEGEERKAESSQRGDRLPDRLDFAKWLVSRENPLTARVTVNRQWAAIFGTGIVRTVEDFGIQGEAPSHPELLDWLALHFMEEGWSLKKLHRLIVTSAAYRQSSRVTPDLLAKDPQNRLLARGPRVRLEAELIRDSVLRASGLLSPTIGGPSVFPPQPASITTEGAYGRLDWKPSEGEDRYRRSLYTFTKRTTPFAMFAMFDAPSGEACVARRDVSDTPLQALTLLNDPMLLEGAQALGKSYAADPRPVEDRIDELFRRCLVRSESEEEQLDLLAFYQAQRQRFHADAAAAKSFAGAESPNVADQAAWASLARALFNLDEFITKN